jgi:uncharacterized membrane protein YfcA
MVYVVIVSVFVFCVDLSRILVYIFFRSDEIVNHLTLTAVLVISALIGVRVGKKWLKSLKSSQIHFMVMSGIIGSGIFYILEAVY